MKNLKTLAALVVAVVLISAIYAFAVEGRSTSWDIEEADAGRTVRHTISGDRGEFVLRDDERTIKAEWRGEFELNDLGTDIVSLDDRFEVAFAKGGVKERAEFQREDGGVQKTYFLNGEEQEEGAETREAVADLLLRFLRASGIKADERVKDLLAQGGAAAALDEIDLVSAGHALSRYAIALAEQTDLSPEELERLTGRLKTVESDHDLARALAAILEHEKITAQTAPVLIGAAEAIRSDHDLRQLVEAFAEQPLDDESLDLAIGLYERIDSDHDLRVAASAFLKRDALKAAQTTRLLAAAARRIDSDHDLRLVLTGAASAFALGDDARAAWLEAYDTLDSDYDKRLALKEIAERGELNTTQWTALVKATEAIESSHDRRLALLAMAERMDRDPALLAAYRQAAESIESENDRERALEALGDD